ncbi:hypothetical protein OSTOST_17201 [Ostertagia ostertagi]
MRLIILAIVFLLAHIADGACVRRKELRWRRFGAFFSSFFRKFLSIEMRTNFTSQDLLLGYYVLLPTSDQKGGTKFLDLASLSYYGDYWPVFMRFRQVGRIFTFEYPLTSQQFMDGLYDCKLEL